MEFHLNSKTHTLSVSNNAHQEVFSLKAYRNQNEMGIFDWIRYIFCEFERIQVAKDTFVFVDRSEVNKKLSSFKANPMGSLREKALKGVLNDILVGYFEKLKRKEITYSQIPLNLRKETPILEQMRADVIETFEANPSRFIAIPQPLNEDSTFIRTLISHPRFTEASVTMKACLSVDISDQVLDDHIRELIVNMPSLLARVKDADEVIELLKQNTQAYHFIPDRFRTYEFYLRMIREVKPLRTNVEFLKTVVKKNHAYISEIKHPSILDRVLEDEELSFNQQVLKHIHPSILQDDGRATFYIRRCPELISQIRLRGDRSDYLTARFVADLIKINYVDDRGHDRYRVNREMFAHIDPSVLNNRDFQSELTWFSDGLPLVTSPEAIVTRLFSNPDRIVEVPIERRHTRDFYQACDLNRYNHPILEKIFHEIQDPDTAIILLERNTELFNRLNPSLCVNDEFIRGVKRSWKIKDQLFRLNKIREITNPAVAVLLERVKDEDELIERLKQKPQAYRSIDDRFRTDEFYLRMTREVKQLKTNVEFLKTVVKKNPACISEIKDPSILARVLEDEELSFNQQVLKHIHPSILQDDGRAEIYIRRCPELISHIRLRGDFSDYLTAIFVADLIKIYDEDRDRYCVNREMYDHIDPSVLNNSGFQIELKRFSD